MSTPDIRPDDMPELPLFKHHRTTDPITSRDAARSALEKAPDSCLEVLRYLLAHPRGRTDHEGTLDTGMRSYRRRRADLKNMGKVVDSGERRAGATKCKMIAWKVKG